MGDPVMEGKTRGNVAHHEGDYRTAVRHFTHALGLPGADAARPILLSNRSASYCLLGDAARALADAEAVVRLLPEWAKGWSRRGAALHLLGRLPEAEEAYARGLGLEPDNDIIARALEEVRSQRAALARPAVVGRLSEEGTAAVDAVAPLRQLPQVVWHLEVLRDRIWLADSPHPPFRPRSLFLFDAARRHLLDMHPHPTQDPLQLEEACRLVTRACTHTSIRPAAVEVSLAELEGPLRAALLPVHIEVHLRPLAPPIAQFLDETVADFEAKEEEHWAKEPERFGAVLQQRQTPGLLAGKGVTLDALRALYAAAAQYVRSNVHLYYTGGVRLAPEGAPPFECTLVRNALGQFGLRLGPPTAPEGSTPSLMFCDESSLPFADAELAEAHGLEVESQRFPLPLLPTPKDRPSVETLRQFEGALRLCTLVLQRTVCQPGAAAEEAWCYTARVTTLAGPLTAVVTIPSTAAMAPEGVLGEDEAPEAAGYGAPSPMHSSDCSPPAPCAPSPRFPPPFPADVPPAPPPRPTSPLFFCPAFRPVLRPGSVSPTSPTPCFGPLPVPLSPSGYPDYPACLSPPPRLPALAAPDVASSSPPRLHGSPPSPPSFPTSTPLPAPAPDPAEAAAALLGFPQVEPSPAAVEAAAQAEARLRAEQRRSAGLEAQLEQTAAALRFHQAHGVRQQQLIDSLERSVHGLGGQAGAALREERRKQKAALRASRAVLLELSGRTQVLLQGLAGADHLLAAWMDVLEVEALLQQWQGRKLQTVAVPQRVGPPPLG